MEMKKVVDIIDSKSAISPRTGLKAYEFVANELKQKHSIHVNFEGVEDLTSAFCNSFIGKLYMAFDPEVLSSLLYINGVEESHIWYKKIENAKLLGMNENARSLHRDNLEEVIFS
jgi:hypothetical protein